jgi:hypothetical protein
MLVYTKKGQWDKVRKSTYEIILSATYISIIYSLRAMNTKTTIMVLAIVAALAVVGLGVAPALTQPAEAQEIRDFLNQDNIQTGGCAGGTVCNHQGSGDDTANFNFGG